MIEQGHSWDTIGTPLGHSWVPNTKPFNFINNI